MEHNKAKQLAQQLLDAEFDCANRNAVEYMKSMGWSVGADRIKRARNVEGLLNFIAKDVRNLTSIIESVDTEEVAEAMESNTVLDFLSNTVAGALTELHV